MTLFECIHVFSVHVSIFQTANTTRHRLARMLPAAQQPSPLSYLVVRQNALLPGCCYSRPTKWLGSQTCFGAWVYALLIHYYTKFPFTSKLR